MSLYSFINILLIICGLNLYNQKFNFDRDQQKEGFEPQKQQQRTFQIVLLMKTLKQLLYQHVAQIGIELKQQYNFDEGRWIIYLKMISINRVKQKFQKASNLKEMNQNKNIKRTKLRRLNTERLKNTSIKINDIEEQYDDIIFLYFITKQPLYL
ncbi:unnamed protein product [Paramecium pentaurelia]|uniref:Transmembrane protein n=1 Tax=Paramecium pentaurelia TaxID=43138 RepID=A0A8S1UTV8_9CILI|nr:unnamed protein product [Paramecium pentaurelia]